MDLFPGIVFRDGPAGRRAGVAGGPDVWEVIEVFQAEGSNRSEAAANLGVRPGLVDAAIAYHRAHRDEIDGWIAANAEMMSAAREASIADPASAAG